MRLINGFKLFNVPVIMSKFEYFNRRKIKEIINNDQILAENIVLDNNNITTMVMTNFIIKIIKLVIIILNISYFLGFFWFIYCNLVMDYYRYVVGEEHHDHSKYFLLNFELENEEQ